MLELGKDLIHDECVDVNEQGIDASLGESAVRKSDVDGNTDIHVYLWISCRKGKLKIKVLTELFTPSDMLQYADLCGWTLAMAHARSAEPSKISGYLGNSDKFDNAVADFSVAYADQSERDHKLLMKAVRNGRLEVETD